MKEERCRDRALRCTLATALGFATALLLWPAVAVPARAEQRAPGEHGRRWSIEWDGTLRGEVAVRTDRPRVLSKERNLIRLRAVAAGPGPLAVTVAVRGFYDAVYDLTDRYPEEVEHALGSEGTLREAFLEWSRGALSIRVGKQQVVWGEAFGRFLTDIVVPKDLREFLLPDFEYIRIPLWMAEGTWTRGDAAIEAVLVPDLRYSIVAPQGADFAPRFEEPATPLVVEPTRKPPRTWRTIESGLRLSWIRSGWEVSALAFSGFDDLPVPFRRIESPPGGGTLVVVMPGPARLTTVGGTVSKGRGRAIYRGELACDLGRWFPARSLTEESGVVRADFLGVIAGVDLALPRRSTLGIQILHQEAIGSSAGRLVGPSGPTVLMLRGLLWEARGRWSAGLEAHFGLDGDSMIRPRVGYRFTDGLQADVGLDLFAGRPESFYGQFDGEDRFYVTISYLFGAASPGAPGGGDSARRPSPR
ncbi:MAG: hypothetical protein DMF51_01795 [Acidobacteria bacterium]|nr:MAG: hypothetical protein DMF51_01795 [Acidobacteriota bacterium]